MCWPYRITIVKKDRIRSKPASVQALLLTNDLGQSMADSWRAKLVNGRLDDERASKDAQLRGQGECSELPASSMFVFQVVRLGSTD